MQAAEQEAPWVDGQCTQLCWKGYARFDKDRAEVLMRRFKEKKTLDQRDELVPLDWSTMPIMEVQKNFKEHLRYVPRTKAFFYPYVSVRFHMAFVCAIGVHFPC